VIAPGFAGLEDQLLLWMLAMLRPGAAFLAAPVFGAPSVPVQVRLVIALGIGIPAIAFSGMAMPPEGIVSTPGILMIISEIALGLALGFAVQIGFAAALLAGEAISNTMGIGFASAVDPMGGQSSAAIGQFLSMLATFLFLTMDGHLMLAGIIVESFQAVPPNAAWLSQGAIEGLVKFGGLTFAAGLSIALPVGFAMVLVQIILGIIGRSAPTLNLFSVGMPAALLAGIILLAMALPAMADGLTSALLAGLEQSRTLAGGK
jgi:flagellar biosynthesis protein FliR